MDIKEFQEKSKRTMRTQATKDTTLNCCLGLSGEVGEVLDLLKKAYFQGHDLDSDKLKEEIGDVMFYIANLCNSFYFDLTEILDLNIIKLEKRFPNGFNEEDSKRRIDHE